MVRADRLIPKLIFLAIEVELLTIEIASNKLTNAPQFEVQVVI